MRLASRDDARVRRHKAVNVRPNLYRFRAERCAYYRGGVVRPASPDCRRHAFRGRADEALRDGHNPLLYQREEALRARAFRSRACWARPW